MFRCLSALPKLFISTTFLLSSCLFVPVPHTVELEDATPEDFASWQASQTTLQYLKSSPRALNPECLEEAFENLDRAIEPIETEPLWRSAFPYPAGYTTVDLLLERVDFPKGPAEQAVRHLVTYRGSTKGEPTDWAGLSATLWEIGSYTPIHHAHGVATAPNAFASKGILVAPVGMVSDLCQAIADRLAQKIAKAEGPTAIAVLGVEGNGTFSAFASAQRRAFEEGTNWILVKDAWAVRRLAQLAERGDQIAQYRLGIHFRRYLGKAEVPDWTAEVQYRLGTFEGRYNEGGLLATDKWRWLKRAADRGHAGAMHQLAQQYWEGLKPAEQDKIEAYKWYALASAHGSKAAAEGLDLARSDLTSEELKNAEKLVGLWKKSAAGFN